MTDGHSAFRAEQEEAAEMRRRQQVLVVRRAMLANNGNLDVIDTAITQLRSMRGEIALTPRQAQVLDTLLHLWFMEGT